MDCTDYKIIADSCCDMTPQLRKRLDVTSIPFSMMLGSKEFVDDEHLDLPMFMSAMKACTEKTGSSAPNPFLYQSAMEEAKNSFVITISGKLSGSYANAIIGQQTAEDANTHVFDSKSAVAGEILIAIKIRELIKSGMPRANIIETVNKFIDNMKTYFVLENHDNLLKNGRLGKITGKLIQALNIKLVMGSNGDGDIALYAKPFGINQMIEKLLDFIVDSGRKTADENIVISHCNNPGLATQLKAAVEKRFNFKEIFVVPTGGLSSLYSDDKGIVMAF